MSNPSTFRVLRDRYQAQLASINNRIKWLSLLRLLVFVAMAAGVYFTAHLSGWPWAIAAVGLTAFLSVVRVHADRKITRRQYQHALAICEEELQRRAGNFQSMDDGARFADPAHPYTSDLGIYGKHSLFQYTSRAQSEPAAARWAGMLGENLVSPEEINSEKDYFSALSEDMDFAVSYLAEARNLTSGSMDFDRVHRWTEQSPMPSGGFRSFFHTRVLPAYSIAGTVAYVLGAISGTAYLWLLLVPALFLMLHLKRHQRVFSEFDSIFGKLHAYERMLALLRTKSEADERLAERWKNASLSESETALRDLKSVAGAMEARNNLFVSIALNILLLWDFQVYRRLARWKSRHASELVRWLDLTVAVEAELSAAVFVHNHPDFVFPEMTEDFDFSLSGARHLILGDEAVPNDMDLTGDNRFSIVTGANMAGKSTYLRTVGLCLTLAMRGMPVPASRMVFRPTMLFTSMVTSDSLGEGESYFFSELKRLKQLTDVLETGRTLFIILDEILKGTNSVDKAVGSKQFLAKMLTLPAKGLIATHDLSLCEIADEYPGRVVNHSFEVEFRGEELHFDYLLREGVCENMNAAYLLRKMGLTLEEEN